MPTHLAQDALSLLSGSFVGFSLGLVGGGGSILAVPLMIYVVGVAEPHVAIGTSALAVALNAAANLVSHARAGTVKWSCAGVFAAAGVIGAFAGSSLSKIIDGRELLALFAVLMMVVAGVMFFRRGSGGDAAVRLNRGNFPRLVGFGAGTGALSGFFGIGGGFLIVPSLMFATGMPIICAVGSSLIAVTAFGATAALNYAISGFVAWRLAVLFIVGGVLGGLVGGRLAHVLGDKRGTLNMVFAGVITLTAIYMLARSTLG
ncbi:MAG TPA: sulfite exporter TauE/SafE family protein [Xanthobacteraceae bacterium]|nr:sulfite exporter TauE/SafE family protein [Xanthobacteraceae bacterium]